MFYLFFFRRQEEIIMELSTLDKVGISALIIALIQTGVAFGIGSYILFGQMNKKRPRHFPRLTNPVTDLFTGTVPGMDHQVLFTSAQKFERYDGLYTVQRYDGNSNDFYQVNNAKRNCFFQAPDITVNPTAVSWQARYYPLDGTYPVMFWRNSVTQELNHFDIIVYINGTSVAMNASNQYIAFYNIFFQVAPPLWPMTKIEVGALLWAYILPTNIQTLDPSNYDLISNITTNPVGESGRPGVENQLSGGYFTVGSIGFSINWNPGGATVSFPF